MQNFFKKTWMLASLFAASTSFAQDNANARQKNCFDGPRNCIEQGHEMAKCQMNCGYAAPACIEVRGSWDVYASGSYLYWQAREDNLDLGLSVNSFAAPTAAVVQHQDVDYKSAFKAGLGFSSGYDNWDLYSEYTWFHGTTNSSLPAVTPFAVGSNVVYPVQGNIFYGDEYYYSANQSWDLKMDLADISLARAHYAGTKLTFRPFVGARGAWIRQYLTTTYAGDAADTAAGASRTIYNSSVSQGVGPRAGFDSNWLVGYGVRLIGNTSADILYSRFRVNSNVSSAAVGSPTATSIFVTEHHADSLKAHASMDLGLGWGSYFDNSNWHVDLAATYGFQVFWDQNMFRNNNAASFGQSTSPNGNLYVHGLTATARIDF